MNNFGIGSRRHFRPGVMALAVVATFGSGAALAQDDNRFYIAPMVTYVLADEDRHSDDGIGGTLAVGTRLSKNAEFELRGTFLKYKDDESGDNGKIKGGGFGANAFLKGPGGPYLHLDVMGGDETLINVGLGWDFLFKNAFGIRAEALYHTQSNSTDDSHDEYKEPLFNLGVRIPFGAAPEPPPAHRWRWWRRRPRLHRRRCAATVSTTTATASSISPRTRAAVRPMTATRRIRRPSARRRSRARRSVSTAAALAT